MNYFLCLSGDKNEIEILPELEELNVGIELQSYGLKGVTSPLLWEEKIKQHKKIIENFSGRFAIHGPFVGIQYTHRDYLLKEAVRNRMRLTYEMAKELKPEILVIHSGMTVDIKKWQLEDIWLEETTNFWKTEIKKYEKEGIKIVVENLVEEPDMLIELCDAVNSDYFTLCMDIGHSNVFSELSPSDWIKKMDKRLQYVHLHDNNGEKDEHLPVGKGNIDFDSFFNSIKDTGNEIDIALELDNSSPQEKMENLIEVINRYTY